MTGSGAATRASERRVSGVVSAVTDGERRPGGRHGVARHGLVLGLALLVAACAGGSQEVAQPTISTPVTADPAAAPADVSIGAREHPRLVVAYGGVYSDPKAERAVARVVGRLVAASDDPSRTYRITILNSPAINAFALPGGYLYVTRGLLALADDASEVAAVLAHEMAHVTANHAIARQRRAEAAAVVNRVAATVVGDPTVARETRETTQLSLARFSQTQELEADQIGVKTLSRAGFDPFAAARFLEAMSRFATLKDVAAGDKPDFLSSHPATPERVALAVRAARQLGGTDIGERDRDAYLASLDGMLYGDDPREGFARGRAFLHRELGIAFTVPPGFFLENTSKAVLASDGGKIAMRFDGVEVPEAMTLPDYLASGWVSGLIPDSVRTLEVNGAPAATASAISGGWSFRIGVLRSGNRVYRFIFATASPTAGFEAGFTETVKSFRRLTPAQVADLKPLRVRIVRVGAGDTIDGLAARMQGIEPAQRRALFMVMNAIAKPEDLKPGMMVKIVTE